MDIWFFQMWSAQSLEILHAWVQNVNVFFQCVVSYYVWIPPGKVFLPILPEMMNKISIDDKLQFPDLLILWLHQFEDDKQLTVY